MLEPRPEHDIRVSGAQVVDTGRTSSQFELSDGTTVLAKVVPIMSGVEMDDDRGFIQIGGGLIYQVVPAPDQSAFRGKI